MGGAPNDRRPGVAVVGAYATALRAHDYSGLYAVNPG
jgi:hypothetical protein